MYKRTQNNPGLRQQLQALIENFRQELREEQAEASLRGNLRLPGIQAFERGQLLRVFPSKKVRVPVPSVDVLVLSADQGIRVAPVHDIVGLATNLDAIVQVTLNEFDRNSDMFKLHGVTYVVACLGIGIELQPTQNTDCVLLGTANKEDVEGAAALQSALITGKWQQRMLGTEARGVKVALALPGLNKVFHVIRGIATPLGDPRFEVYALLREKCAWLQRFGT
jgi:hypothetical protein